MDKTEKKNALDTQIGGSHYKKMKIQPIEYILANDIGFVEGAVIKYVSRWKSKNGVEDLKKARHLLDILIESKGDVKAQSKDSGLTWIEKKFGKAINFVRGNGA